LMQISGLSRVKFIHLLIMGYNIPELNRGYSISNQRSFAQHSNRLQTQF